MERNGNGPHDLTEPLILAEPLFLETNALVDDLRKEKDWHDEGSNNRTDQFGADTFQADTFGADEHPSARTLLGRA